MEKILVYKWKAYNYLDIISSFEKEGFEVEIIEKYLTNYDEDYEFAEVLMDKIKSGAYSFVFTVNYFALISEVCHDLDIPYVVWTCDSPLISMYHESVFYDTNFIFTFDKTHEIESKSMGVKNIFYLPLATNPDRMISTIKNFEKRKDCSERLNESLHGDVEEDKKYDNDISFVGSLYERNTYDKIYDTLPDYLKGYFDGIILLQSDLYGANMLEDALTPEILSELSQYFALEKSSEKSFSDLSVIFPTTVLGYKVARIQRINSLNALSQSKINVSIYSNSDVDVLSGVKYKGGLDYWTEMPLCFYYSKINLNFTIPNIKSGIPLRLFDILGARGFALTNYQAEVPEYFEDGKDLGIYYGKDDLVEKVKFYLTRDSLREKIRESGFEKVKKYHTVDARIGELLRTIKEYSV